MTKSARLKSVVAVAVVLGLIGATAWLLERGRVDDATLSEAPPVSLRYDTEYPAVGYSSRTPDNRVTRLAARIAAGEVELAYDAERGFLESLLDALEIDPASQVLVFSKTSLQVRYIGPSTPRAIYFNDDTYVAFVRDAETIEIATMDPALGPMFFTLSQARGIEPAFERHNGRCLRCHDSLSLTGGGVPRFMLGSGYIGADGRDLSHEGRIITSQATPLRYRWGGWYVTGHHGDQVHLGNIVVRDPAALTDLESLRDGNRATLDGLVDTSPYLTGHSDIVALLVLQHQTDVQNAITRARFDAVTALDTLTAAALPSRLADIAEPLVKTLFLVDAVDISDPISGTSGFAADFEARGPRDGRGRSLRDLDLETGLFRYPLSYLIYSEGFDGLPEALAVVVRTRIREVLDGDDAFDHLTQAQRAAIREILAETKPALLTSG